jgi:putative redox protein
MKAQVDWKGRLTFTGTADSGFDVPLGSYPEVGGDDDGFRPMELIAVGLAGCTAMDVISILMKKRQEVLDFQVRVIAERADQHPKVFTEAVIEYHLAGKDISEAAVTRSLELSAESYCPAQAMLGKVFPMSLRYIIYEGDTIDQGVKTIEGALA